MPTYNLKEYNDNYSKTSDSFKFKSKCLDNTNNECVIYAKIAVPLRYLSNF